MSQYCWFIKNKARSLRITCCRHFCIFPTAFWKLPNIGNPFQYGSIYPACLRSLPNAEIPFIRPARHANRVDKGSYFEIEHTLLYVSTQFTVKVHNECIRQVYPKPLLPVWISKPCPSQIRSQHSCCTFPSHQKIRYLILNRVYSFVRFDAVYRGHNERQVNSKTTASIE